MDERVTEEFNRTRVVNQSIRRFRRIADGLQELEQTAAGRLYEMVYERLRTDTFAEMRHLAHVLGISCDEAVLRAAVAKNAYERIPAERKGPGKFVRTARVGGWRRNWSRARSPPSTASWATSCGRGATRVPGEAGKPDVGAARLPAGSAAC